jgi:predicted phage terminase large subunit-like protein
LVKSLSSESPATAENQRVIEPQPGPQTQFLECEADIAIFGGSAGGSKSYSILLDILRGVELAKYRALILRRQLKDLTDEGSLIDDARDVFGAAGAKENGSTHSFKWPCGASVSMGHMENAAKDHERYKSKAYAAIYFEELTEFEKHQFWYMLSRNRSVCGMSPYIRATTNPKPGWVADLLIAGGYVDPDTGLAIEAMSGVIRYIIRDGDNIYWYDSVEEAQAEHPDEDPLSFTFIRSRLEDNKILLDNDPGYLKRIKGLGRVERMRLYDANWIVVPAAGLYYQRMWWHIAHRLPEFTALVRAWDLAGSKVKPGEKKKATDLDWVAGVLMGVTRDKKYYIIDLKHFKGTPGQVRDLVRSTIEADREQWGRVLTRIPQDPGQAGVDQIDNYSTLLAGYRVKFVRPTGSKITRTEGFSSQVEHGNVHLLYAPWNEKLITESEQFPDAAHDDIVDAMSDAFNELLAHKSSFSGNW